MECSRLVLYWTYQCPRHGSVGGGYWCADILFNPRFCPEHDETLMSCHIPYHISRTEHAPPYHWSWYDDRANPEKFKLFAVLDEFTEWVLEVRAKHNARP